MTSELLIVFGFSWMVVAALIGLYLGAKHGSHADQLRAAAVSGNLPDYHRLFEAYKWQGTVHAHGMLFSLSSIGIGLVMSRAGGTFPFSEAVVGALIISTTVWTLAALRRVRALMGLADLLFLVVLVTVAFGVAYRH